MTSPATNQLPGAPRPPSAPAHHVTPATRATHFNPGPDSPYPAAAATCTLCRSAARAVQCGELVAALKAPPFGFAVPIASETVSQWVYRHQNATAIETLCASLRISPMLSKFLLNRGLSDPAEADKFLAPKLSHLHDPRLLADMDRAVGRILAAKDRGEHVRVFGDYDVDGTSATALLCLLLGMVGVRHSYTIPRREKDGYGLSVDAVEAAKRDGVAVMITVDNGVSAIDAVRRANELGIDMVITDHHTIVEMPPAFAIIHPTRTGQDYPFPHLCGAGLAFKLAHGVLQAVDRSATDHAEIRQFFQTALAFAALATVCDVVPLVGENRVISSLGLKALAATSHPGLRALCDVSGLDGAVDAQDIGFKLGPRINAASRMGEDDLAIRLMTATDPEAARELALALDTLNRRRQGVERKASIAARQSVDDPMDDTGERVLVLASSDYPAGVAGIIAARMVDSYAKPAIVLHIGPDGIAKGSGRSTKDFQLHSALTCCGHLMQRFGGHAVAVGLTMEAANISELRRILNERAGEFESFVPRSVMLEIDSVVPAAALVPGLARDVESLAPFGEGNPEPLLAVEGAKLVGKPRLVGKTNAHLSMQVTPPGGRGIRAFGFNLGGMLPSVEAARSLNLAFRPVISTWTGDPTLELHVKEVQAAGD